MEQGLLILGISVCYNTPLIDPCVKNADEAEVESAAIIDTEFALVSVKCVPLPRLKLSKFKGELKLIAQADNIIFEKGIIHLIKKYTETIFCGSYDLDLIA